MCAARLIIIALGIASLSVTIYAHVKFGEIYHYAYAALLFSLVGNIAIVVASLGLKAAFAGAVFVVQIGLIAMASLAWAFDWYAWRRRHPSTSSSSVPKRGFDRGPVGGGLERSASDKLLSRHRTRARHPCLTSAVVLAETSDAASAFRDACVLQGRRIGRSKFRWMGSG
ncbi:hypothetical protein EJ06DRAFT_546619 [Trichodelitschia bisporula]|uniref:MARVEL domain-containing protein n=1 Tax=Trichodelitschia bisporula TaxID=703511 RepID=A0A6G1I5I6_9PEZI|nr:hypothetical protein EJ06DRAFT_546619 [Trichodelitschia bisporula]